MCVFVGSEKGEGIEGRADRENWKVKSRPIKKDNKDMPRSHSFF